MNYLKGKTVYLCGNIHQTKQQDYGIGWRDTITPVLEDNFGVVVINPCKSGKGDSQKDQEYFKQLIKDKKFSLLKEEFYRVIKKDLRAVDKADFIICYHNPLIPTVGSIHEIINASNQKKPVLIVCDKEYINDINPWLLTIIKPQWLFESWDDMVIYLKTIDNECLDSSHWWV